MKLEITYLIFMTLIAFATGLGAGIAMHRQESEKLCLRVQIACIILLAASPGAALVIGFLQSRHP